MQLCLPSNCIQTPKIKPRKRLSLIAYQSVKNKNGFRSNKDRSLSETLSSEDSPPKEVAFRLLTNGNFRPEGESD